MTATSIDAGRMRVVRLVARPCGALTASNFEVADVPVPSPVAGEALVRVAWLSVDPYMRELMDEVAYLPSFQVGQPLKGRGIGIVIRSDEPDRPLGRWVLGQFPWQEYACAPASELTTLDPGLRPITVYLGVLGATGLAAYAGLVRIGRVRPGDTVYVSAAAGAVGSVAAQVAQILGGRVVGTAGSAAKVTWLREVAKLDGAYNYKEISPDSALPRLCPEGIDVYFDNVGGAHLCATLRHMKRFGRVVLCGSIGEYDSPGTAPLSLLEAVNRRLTLQGFIVSDHHDLLPEFRERMGKWVMTGQVRSREYIVEGLENAPSALVGLFRGANLGKTLISVTGTS